MTTTRKLLCNSGHHIYLSHKWHLYRTEIPRAQFTYLFWMDFLEKFTNLEACLII